MYLLNYYINNKFLDNQIAVFYTCSSFKSENSVNIIRYNNYYCKKNVCISTYCVETSLYIFVFYCSLHSNQIFHFKNFARRELNSFTKAATNMHSKQLTGFPYTQGIIKSSAMNIMPKTLL